MGTRRAGLALGNKVDKHAWEFMLLHEARTALRAGDLTVEGSQRYAAWDTDLYQSDIWATRRDAWYNEQEVVVQTSRILLPRPTEDMRPS